MRQGGTLVAILFRCHWQSDKVANFATVATAFTFAVLDDFLLDNLECGTSAMNYYSKLRQITSSVFPHLVPDQYRELVRVGRQWRQVKQLKWHGFSHEKSLVMDGNFKAEHLYLANPTDEVALTNGLGFMAQDIVQRLDCNNHLAINQENASCHKLEATGIGSQRQMNMDYALCQALGYNTNGINRAFTFYDINCQYHKHLSKRIEESPYLDLPWGMDIIPGIGLCSPIQTHGVEDSQHAFDQLTETAKDDAITKWEAEATAAQDDRPHNLLRPYSRGIRSEGLWPQLMRCAPFPSTAPYFRAPRYHV
ncbi:hypothetical protein F4604DRAFT_1674916 [Suillus subluteus]|nr:hypothetical protein F4604DRAFT_1674916 [Suillus subluteus]